MMNSEENNHREVTLKDLILTIKEFIAYVFEKWYVVAIICFVTMALFMYKHKRHTNTYPATIRFVVEGQTGGGSLGSLLGTFGIKKGGKINPFKILEVGRSTVILRKAVLQKDTNGEYLGDLIINELDIIDTENEVDERLVGFTMRDFKLDSEVSNKILKRIKARIWGGQDTRNSIASLTFDDDAGIFTLRAESISEDLSINLSYSIYELVKEFFESEVFENQSRSTEILKMKMDSLKQQRDVILEQIARTEDNNQNTILSSGNLQLKKLSYDLSATGAAYAEVLKNYEMTDVNLKDQQPLFMVIDTPFKPLPLIESSLILNLMLGGFIGTFLGVFVVVLQKIYRNIMDN